MKRTKFYTDWSGSRYTLDAMADYSVPSYVTPSRLYRFVLNDTIYVYDTERSIIDNVAHSIVPLELVVRTVATKRRMRDILVERPRSGRRRSLYSYRNKRNVEVHGVRHTSDGKTVLFLVDKNGRKPQKQVSGKHFA